MSSSFSEPESPLDVLSRAATMVEKNQIDNNRDSQSPTSTNSSQSKGCERSPSFKERHPKFRKSATPDYLVAAQFHRQNSSNSGDLISSSSPPLQQQQQHHNNMDIDVVSRLSPPPHPSASLIYSYHNLQQLHQLQQLQQQQQQQHETEEGPLDMSIKKRARSNTPPPPYRFTPLFASSIPNPPPPPYYPPSQMSPPTLSNDRLPPPPSYEASTQFALRASALASIAAQAAAVQAAQAAVSQPQPPPRRASPEILPEDSRPIREITIITADSSADPLLDEHFRRSLGANYQSLFKKTSPTPPPQLVTSSVSQNHSVTSRVSQNHSVTSSMKSRSPSLSPDSSSSSLKVVDPVVKAFKDEMDMEGYTVEDHFAKALGATWVKLQAQAEEAKAAAKENGKSNKAQLVAL